MPMFLQIAIRKTLRWFDNHPNAFFAAMLLLVIFLILIINWAI
jgi:hypothetical protein